MKKDLKFICVQPDDVYYIFQVRLWIESLREIGQSEKAIVLVFTPYYRERNTDWDLLVAHYKEVTFSFIADEDKVSDLFGIYIPVLRPYSLYKFFEKYPQMNDKAFFYCDCDILFLPDFNIDKFVDDDINYLSDTNSYINADYFDSKIKDVLEEKLEEYKKRDVLQEVCEIVGISREIAVNSNMHSGGAQYLLKNINAEFWQKVGMDCIKVREHLLQVNREFFENENKGFQSWCADMWSVLYNVWYRKGETKVIPEMEFAWSTDNIEKLKTTTILHNAGVTGNFMDGVPMFYKGHYHTGNDPLEDDHLTNVFNDEINKTKCNHYYVSKLLQLKESQILI